jgi:hypothetical protein
VETKKGQYMSPNSNNSEVKSTDHTIDLSRGLPNFIIKTFVIVFSVTFALSALIPELPKIPETERNKLLLLSFIQSPYVLWRLSVIEEEKGDIKNAITFMEAAISLMEMNGASDSSIKKYHDRLSKLTKK